MNHSNTKKLIFCCVAVAINVVLGATVSMLSIPLLFLDTLGTIFISASFGMSYGIMTGVATNLLMGITSGVTAIPFALVNVAVAIIVSLMAKRGFSTVNAVFTGIILAIVCPLIGTPIRIALFGGLTGSGTDLIILALRAAGKEVFSSTFIGAVSANIVDKIASCLLVSLFLKHSAIKRLTHFSTQ